LFLKRCFLAVLCISIILSIFFIRDFNGNKIISVNNEPESKKKIIKYVEFNIPYDALEKTLNLDIKSHREDSNIKFNWIELLAYLACKYGGNFQKNYKEQDIKNLKEKLESGTSIEELTKKMKNYNYFKEAYTAVLGGFVGKYKIEVKKEGSEEKVFEEKYGLKVFSPIAKTFPFSHCMDFRTPRTFGYSRPHLGHDLMAATGTPVIAVESGYVEATGWNKYGGWRLGIRSFDKKRYYYYAHLRKNRPYHESITEGKIVKAGDVIGYIGRTGYSSNENVNNIQESHLHLGLQLIFDESQKECNNEIWINLYEITQLLQKNKSSVKKVPETKEYYREFDFSEESLEKEKEVIKIDLLRN